MDWRSTASLPSLGSSPPPTGVAGDVRADNHHIGGAGGGYGGVVIGGIEQLLRRLRLLQIPSSGGDSRRAAVPSSGTTRSKPGNRLTAPRSSGSKAASFLGHAQSTFASPARATGAVLLASRFGPRPMALSGTRFGPSQQPKANQRAERAPEHTIQIGFRRRATTRRTQLRSSSRETGQCHRQDDGHGRNSRLNRAACLCPVSSGVMPPPSVQMMPS